MPTRAEPTAGPPDRPAHRQEVPTRPSGRRGAPRVWRLTKIVLPFGECATTKTCFATETCVATSNRCAHASPVPTETAGARIERIAREKNLPSGLKLAALFGVSYETLRKWRDGETSPSRNRQQRVSEVLGVAPGVFMHGTDGGQAGEPLKPDEARLLRAYRQVLKADKAQALRQLETRAREIEELELRISSERAAPASEQSWKRRTASGQ